jgi:hypothetical protein
MSTAIRDALSAMAKNAFYAARDRGDTMHKAADDTADAILASGILREVKAEAYDEGARQQWAATERVTFNPYRNSGAS